ncbi:hypothetical protein, partial [Cesiribacter andamanensis]|uniref:hypothetical protein n=1 Tax=Cesiribacter andamanensis TaxID=649507 RepID=UPI00058E4124
MREGVSLVEEQGIEGSTALRLYGQSSEGKPLLQIRTYTDLPVKKGEYLLLSLQLKQALAGQASAKLLYYNSAGTLSGTLSDLSSQQTASWVKLESQLIQVPEDGTVLIQLENNGPEFVMYADEVELQQNTYRQVAHYTRSWGIKGFQDYYAWGAPLPNRSYSPGPRRWGYQGEYSEDETNT